MRPNGTLLLAFLIVTATLTGPATLMTMTSCALAAPPSAGDSTAFYYGKDVPEDLLQVYRRVVVEPDAIADPARLTGRRARLLAYLSVGELADTARTRPRAMKDDWSMGRNHAWNSRIMDLTNPGWQRWLVDVRMRDLWRQGYRGFFLDTLDSFRLAGLDQGGNQAQLDALVSLIERMHRRYPSAEILVNRGFEILPRIAHRVHGVVAESLFDRWDAAAQQYQRVPEDDRRWLQDRLEEARDDHGLPVIVIDYRPPAERAQARDTARRIAALGFSPWVTNAALDMVGVGVPEVLPRRVLVLYDGAREPLDRAPALRLLAPVLEHEGRVPVFHDVQQPLPHQPLAGRYAGIVSWFPGPVHPDHDAPARYGRWLTSQLEDGVRVAMLGHPGFPIPDPLLARMGLRRVIRRPDYGPRNAPETRYSALVGFEARPRPHRVLASGFVADDPWVEPHLRVADARGPLVDPVLTAVWGGMALAPYLLEQGYEGAQSWVIDPFAFVRTALALEPLPVPDLTTENGRRLFMAHVDAAGARQPAELRGTPRTASVVRSLLARQRLPHTTNDRTLAHGLAHVTEAEPPLTGPGAGITRIAPSLTQLVPSVRPDESGNLELLWPIADEDGYRVPGQAPFGFRRVIETFELTDAGRRLAPLALRYHAYSGSNPAGRRALQQIYAWLAKQDILPVRADEYAAMVRDFRRVALARELDGTLRVHGLGSLRTLRLPRDLGWPDLARSPAVAAVRDLPQGRYITLTAPARTAGGRARLVLADDAPGLPYIADSNARVLRFTRVRKKAHARGHAGVVIELRLRGHLPVSVTVAKLPSSRCVMIGRGFRVQGKPAADGLRFDLPMAAAVTDTGPARVVCER